MVEEDVTEYEKISLKPIKGSRKSKKSWRKHGDIADVEVFLDGVRRDERTGGALSDKPDEALFVLEKTPGKQKITEKKRRNKDEIEAGEDDDEEYVPRKKKLETKLSKEAEILKKKKEEARQDKVQTIWGQEVLTVTDAYLESTIKRKKVKPKTVNVGKSDTSAVVLPEPGASYNPDYDSHQDLLLRAHVEEEKRVKEQEKWNKKVKMVSVKELKKQSKLWLEEMSQGLSQKPDKSENDKTESSKPEFAPPPVSAENRKTAQKRRKELLMKKAKQLKLEQKWKKARLNDIMRIKSLKKEIRNSKNKSSELHVKRSERKSSHEGRAKRLGKHKFVEPRINVHLSEELSGSLRQLKPDGNLIKDRFKSFQRRNIIEPRNRVLPHTRYKRKVIVKRSYKNSNVKDFKSSAPKFSIQSSST